MDGSRFDDLTKALAASRSRRGVLGALAGAMLGAAGLSQSAEARACRSLGNSCAANGDCCSGRCVAEGRTRKICHCASAADCPAVNVQCQTAACLANGSCGAAIALDAPCDDGNLCTVNAVCQPDGSCAGIAKDCDDQNACTVDTCDPATGRCVNTLINCDDGNACITDACDPANGCVHQPVDCDDGDACTTDACDPIRGCVYTAVNCDDNDRCTIDSCDPATGCVYTPVACPPATNECFTAGTCQRETGACSDPIYHGDQAACSTGVCHDNVCCTPADNATTCAGGKCGPQTNNCGQTVQCLTLAGGSCAQDDQCCSGICVTDAQGLNGVCQAGPVAVGGACDSNGDCASHACCGGFCRDTAGDPDHCGACATVCSNNNMATRTCTAGVCTGTCDPGFADCNGNKQTDGCEIDLLHDSGHCGTCGTSCPLAVNGAPVCSNGTCAIACDPGFTLCSGQCVNLATDPDHCGSCTTVCSNNNMATRTCAAGVCNGTCAAGFTDCDGNKQTNGCEIHTAADPDHCGGCTTICSNNNMATRTCAGGTCNGTCASGYADCNGNKQSDGCEIHIAGDASNCGGCALVCTGANATMTCTSSVCQVASCSAPFANCDGNPANGCEVNTSTNNSHCGACNHACTGTGVTCGGGGTPGVCGCTPESSATTCSNGKCGSHTNNCGQSVNCGGCGSGQVCASDGSMCKSTNPASACAGKNAFCNADLPACSSNRFGDCACVPTVEGGGICEGGAIAGDPCTSSAQCPGAALCVDMTCDGQGKFCMSYAAC